MDFGLLAKMASRNINNLAITIKTGPIEANPIFSQLPDYAKRAAASRIYFSPANKFYYARIPKCANSTLVKTFSKHCGFVNKYDPIGKKAKKIFKIYPNSSDFASAKKVVFFRDPLTRAVSAWLDKGHNPELIKKYKFAGDVERTPTFLEFLNSFEESEFHQDPHFIPQTSMVPGDLSQYYIGTVENIDEDLPRICEAIFGVYLGMEVKQSGRTHAHKKSDEISKEAHELALKIYKKDFELYSSLESGSARL